MDHSELVFITLNSTKDAASMDPQQRWTLEAAYRAMENCKPDILCPRSMMNVWLSSISRDTSRKDRWD